MLFARQQLRHHFQVALLGRQMVTRECPYLSGTAYRKNTAIDIHGADFARMGT